MENRTYWCVEGLLNGRPIWWTGNIPHLSVQQSEAGVDMWVTDIHKAKKFETKEEAEKENKDFEVKGEVTEHMDI